MSGEVTALEIDLNDVPYHREKDVN